jgi:hypothetical protein
MKRVILLLFLFTGCIDPYFPPDLKSSEAFLVVDGFIDVTTKSTIKLSRTQSLNTEEAIILESGASVWIEDKTGNKIFLSEESAGTYVLPAQSFSSLEYNLNIVTKDTKKYASDFVPIVKSPPIDSVSWELFSGEGIQIYVNTHNTESPEGFYRWTFEETWAYTSAYQSTYVFNPSTKTVSVRSNNIYNCWASDNSNDIIIESTKRLSENIVSEFPLKYITNTSEELRYKYSILVNQYAITEEAFKYWQQQKKNTEDLGTLFGPLPTQITGNFRCVSNPAEPILGYFHMGSLSSKRIFISFEQLPTPPFYNTGYSNCDLGSVLNEDLERFSGPFTLVGGIPSQTGPGVIGYSYSSQFCVDCTLRGGTTTKPDFWE